MEKLTAVITLLMGAVVACINVAYGDDNGDAKRSGVVAAKCAGCHGRLGDRTISQLTPKLAQQRPVYIAKELYDFKSGARDNPAMASVAATLSDRDIKDVEAYFPARTMTADRVKDESLANRGRKIFSGGVPGMGVPACASCHGEHGEGMPLTMPRLAGQHARYVVAQLKSFKSGRRANDPDGVMRKVASKLSIRQMEAAAEYVSGL